MGWTAKEYAKNKGIKERKIKKWFEADYLGLATRNEKTGIYDIPEDTPVPYSADCRITRKSSLWKELLDAADLQQAIFPSMYPKLDPELVQSQIDEFASGGLLTVRTTNSGCKYLDITPEGHAFLQSLSEAELKKTLEKAEKCISATCNVIQALATVAPLLMNI